MSLLFGKGDKEFVEDFAKWYTWYNTNKDKLKWNEEKQQYTISE